MPRLPCRRRSPPVTPRPPRSTPSAVRVIGDPGEAALHPLRRIADRDEGAEHDPDVEPGGERPASGDRPAPARPGASRAGRPGCRCRLAQAGQVAVGASLLDLVEVVRRGTASRRTTSGPRRPPRAGATGCRCGSRPRRPPPSRPRSPRTGGRGRPARARLREAAPSSRARPPAAAPPRRQRRRRRLARRIPTASTATATARRPVRHSEPPGGRRRPRSARCTGRQANPPPIDRPVAMLAVRWTSTSTRARSSSGASGSPSPTGGSRRPPARRAGRRGARGPVVVKAQVLTGGRGKAGGIKLAADAHEAEERAKEILGLDIRGHVVRKLWVERASDIAKEYYLSLTFDRGAKRRSTCSRRGAASTSSRSPRRARGARPAPRRSPRGLPPVAGAAARLRSGRDRPVGAEADRGDRREAPRGVHPLRRDALRDQPADRHAGGRGQGARLEVHGRRQRALPSSRRSPRCATATPPTRSRRSRARSTSRT